MTDSTNTAPTWHDQAACVGYRTDIFYPWSPDEIDPTAAALCAGCPVRRDCLDWALAHNEEGTWAGTTERQRAGLRRLHGHTTQTRPRLPVRPEPESSLR